MRQVDGIYKEIRYTFDEWNSSDCWGLLTLYYIDKHGTEHTLTTGTHQQNIQQEITRVYHTFVGGNYFGKAQ